MLKKITSSFLLAFHNIRSHFFHTLLSVLGIVIGVAALVAILSLIDGMEQYAKDQLTRTTSLKAISIQSQPYITNNGVRVRRDSIAILGINQVRKLKAALTKPATVFAYSAFNELVTTQQHETGAVVYASGTADRRETFTIKAGRWLTDGDIDSASLLAIVNLQFARSVDSTIAVTNFVGKELTWRNYQLRITGVYEDNSPNPTIVVPMSLVTARDLNSNTPSVAVEAANVEDVAPLKKEVQEWLQREFQDKDLFSVVTNEMRVEQATQGFLLFRIIMGLIVGISVLVGGIGIMNVLLISITERTVEIGIRKAVGANRRDIILQFLAESVTVSFFGSVVGAVLGILGTMAFVPIVKAITDLPFQANYTVDTLLVVGSLAILLGIIFGTYPAIRASKLDPVEAIRHE